MRTIARFLGTFCVTACFVGGSAVEQAAASPLELDFSSQTNSAIVFNPTNVGTAVGSFTFSHSVGATDFTITNAIPSGPALNLTGNISGTFLIGPITTLNASPLLQEATVTSQGPTTISITDLQGHLFTATLDLKAINVLVNGQNSSYNLNPSSLVNLTNLSYSGTNPQLLALLADEYGASLSITFNIQRPPKSLTQLTSGTGNTNVGQYSGNIVAAPEPMSFALLTMGLLGLSPLALILARSRKPTAQ